MSENKMLEEAHQLRAKRLDVVNGLLETHGRTETEEKVGVLGNIPRRAVGSRDTTPA